MDYFVDVQRNELKYLISFIDKSNDLFDFDEEAIAKNSIWKIYSYLLQSHLDNKLVTISSLAHSCGLPRATAIRKIKKLINKKIIIQKPRTSTGKTYSLHPSEKLYLSFTNFLEKTKEHIAHSLGYENEKNNNFYFGTSLLSANIIPKPTQINLNCDANEEISILFNDNQTFKIIKRSQRYIENLLGLKLNIYLKSNDSLRKELIKNSKLKNSNYDIVCFDVPWTGEIYNNKYLLPLNDMISNDNLNIKDFHPEGINASSYNNKLYGLPIEQVASIMVYREDILKKLNLNIPRTISDLFFCLKKIKDSDLIKYPFAWPGKSGFTLGCHFMEMMGNLGSPIIELRKISDSVFETNNLDSINKKINVFNAAGAESIFLLFKIINYSHPDTLKMNWDDVAESYSNGEVAMANIWSGRSGFFENDVLSPARKKSIYDAKPGGKEGYQTSSIGGYSLGLPSNINRKKIKLSFSVIKYFVSPNMIKYYIEKGVTTSPLFSVSNDPVVQEISPSVLKIDKLQKTGKINSWSRLPLPEFTKVANIIGDRLNDEFKKSSNLHRQKSMKIVREIQNFINNSIYKKVS